MFFFGVGPINWIKGALDYAKMLQETILTMKYHWVGSHNRPKHTSEVAKKWFADNSIRVLEWPKWTVFWSQSGIKFVGSSQASLQYFQTMGDCKCCLKLDSSRKMSEIWWSPRPGVLCNKGDGLIYFLFVFWFF